MPFRKPRFVEYNFVATMTNGEQLKISMVDHSRYPKSKAFKQVKASLGEGVQLEAVTPNNFLYFLYLYGVTYMMLIFVILSVIMFLDGNQSLNVYNAFSLPYDLSLNWFELILGFALALSPVVLVLALFNRRKYV